MTHKILNFLDVRKIDPLHGNPKQITGLDGIRAFSFLLIFIFHIWYINQKKEIALTVLDGVKIDLTHLFSQGFMGVPFFFILSGFLLSLPFLAALEGKYPFPNIYRYFQKRAFRIVPAYYVAIFIMILSTPVVPCNDCRNNFWSQLLTHMSFTHTFTEYTMAGIASPLWAVGVEVHFYLILPGIMWLLFQFRYRPQMIIVGLFLIMAVGAYFTITVPRLVANLGNVFHVDQTIVSSSGKVPIWNILHLFSIFFIGVLMAYIYRILLRKSLLHINVLSGICLVFSGTIILVYLLLPGVKDWFWGYHLIMSSYGWPFIPFIFGIFILCISLQRGLVKKFSEWPPLKILGLVSYGMYLYHMTILHVLYKYLPIVRESIMKWAILSFILTFIMALLSFRYIEVIFLEKKKFNERSINRNVLE